MGFALYVACGVVEEEATSGMTAPRARITSDPADAFDWLYARDAAPLARQAFLLCGQQQLAERAVTRGFQRAWERWADVAVAPDPGSWIRAATYGYALSPWHRFFPGRCGRPTPAAPPPDRALLQALADLPRCYRHSLVLHDYVGLGLRETAWETEASARATASRVENARQALTAQVPRLAEAGPAALGQLLADIAAAVPVRPAPAPGVRAAGERRTRRQVWAGLGVTAALAIVLVAAVLAPTLPFP